MVQYHPLRFQAADRPYCGRIIIFPAIVRKHQKIGACRIVHLFAQVQAAHEAYGFAFRFDLIEQCLIFFDAAQVLFHYMRDIAAIGRSQYVSKPGYASFGQERMFAVQRLDPEGPHLH